MLLHQLEVLLRVERRGALDPGMDRVGRDDVELFLRRQDVVPRVVVHDLHARVLHDVVVLLREVRRHDLRDQRLDLADHDALDTGMQHERSGRHARAESDDEHRLRSLSSSAERWPSMRCSRMSCGSLDASTLPLTWKLRTPFATSETAIDEFIPSPT